jgi:putative nucleotidyltransferase with HDIG domain
MPARTSAHAGRCGPAAARRRRTSRPSETTCRRILREHRVPEHIRRHSGRVASVARRIARGLAEHAAEPVDVALVSAAALLHDIAKAPCLGSRLDHAREGGRVLRAIGLAEIGAIVERHVTLGPFSAAGPVSAAEIVNYADKRVRYVEVVSLGERFEDLIARYGGGRAAIERRIRANWMLMEEVETKIFSRLPFGPDALRSAARPDRARR